MLPVFWNPKRSKLTALWKQNCYLLNHCLPFYLNRSKKYYKFTYLVSDHVMKTKGANNLSIVQGNKHLSRIFPMELLETLKIIISIFTAFPQFYFCFFSVVLSLTTASILCTPIANFVPPIWQAFCIFPMPLK